MPTITTVLTQAFEPQHGTSKSNGKPWTRSDFKDQNGERYSTFRGDVASVARALLNQPVTIEYTSEQNGQYTNNTLTAVTAINASPAQADTSTWTVADHSQTATASNSYTPDPRIVTEPERQLRIMRQSALDRALTAFGIAGQDPLGALPELYELADEFIDYFTNGRVEIPVEA